MSKNKILATNIIDLLGGKDNIAHVTHCATRLRISLNDDNKKDLDTLKNLDGVLGLQVTGQQIQIILGGKVNSVYKEVEKIVGKTETIESEDTLFNKVTKKLSSILIASLAPIIGGGMIKGLLFLFVNIGWLNPDSGTYFVLNIASDSMFYFFPFLVAVAAAREFETNEYMALAIAGALMYPSLLDAVVPGEIITIKFANILPISMINYSGSIIPIILSTWLLKYIDNFVKKIVPDVLTIVITPLIVLVITIPIVLSVVAPIGFYIGEYIAKGVTWLISFSPLLAGFVIGATRPFLVLTGMHHAIRPITQIEIAAMGYSLIGPMNFMSTMAQATAALAIFVSTRDKNMKQIALSSTISGYIGITEPALFGVLVNLKSAFIGASLGGGIGGAVGAIFGAQQYALAMPSILSIPVFLGNGTSGFFIAVAATVVSTFLITFTLHKANFDRKDDING